MKVVSVVGARPQFVKLAPVSEALHEAGHQHVIVHTGQHYDARMSDIFFADLAIPAPDVHLGVGSGSHGVQTGRMLAELDRVLLDASPDWVLVYGDTNSTLAGAVAAVKLHLRVAHLEAGLRSNNRAMPEEHNRVLTDHAADLLLAPTHLAMANLAREGLADRARLVGDVMTDICLRVAATVTGQRPTDVFDQIGDAEYILATVHRAENTDDPDRLRRIVAALQRSELRVLLSGHPRLMAKADAADVSLEGGAVRTIRPLSYPDMVAAVAQARAVVTDSGGLQKEALLLGTTCTTLRRETEWRETLEDDWNVLVGSDLPNLSEVVLRPIPSRSPARPYGNGHAAAAVVDALNRN